MILSVDQRVIIKVSLLQFMYNIPHQILSISVGTLQICTMFFSTVYSTLSLDALLMACSFVFSPHVKLGGQSSTVYEVVSCQFMSKQLYTTYGPPG